MAKRKSFLLRMNPQLYQELEAWAEQDMRSVNGQIEFLLKQAVDRRRGKEATSDKSDMHKKRGERGH